MGPFHSFGSNIKQDFFGTIHRENIKREEYKYLGG